MNAPSIDFVRAQDYLRARYNPIAGLTPERLTLALDQFRRGWFRELAWIMEAIEERDDTVTAVAPKRKKAPARYGWQIATVEETPEAARHKDALAYFFNNLTATNAIEQDEVGDISLLLQQMMDAVGHRYAVHEMVWVPKGKDLTATFWKVPLAFFEGTVGRLRFLQQVNQAFGSDMDPAGWLVSVGQGVGIATAVAYMYKQLPLRDWLVYSGRHGMPGIEGVTDAAPGTPEWQAMVNVVQMAGSEMGWVRSSSQAVNKVDFGAKGELPYPALVDRMDRAISRLWRGVDLSTMSSSEGQGRGASLQGDESEILEQDDAAWLGRSLVKVSRQVIAWYFGAGVQPLAFIKILSRPEPQNVEADIRVDEHLLKYGVELSKEYAREKYNRPQPGPNEQLMEPAAAAPAPGAPAEGEDPEPAANEARGKPTAAELLERAARDQVARAQAAALAPLRTRLRQIAAIDDDQARLAELRALRRELPALLRAMNAEPAAAAALERAIQTAFLNGAAESAFSRTP